MDESPDLSRLVREATRQQASAAVVELARRVRERFGESAQAVLFYGSCLRTGSEEGLIDLYVLVDRYRSAYRSRGLAAANRLLPPNVFYFDFSHEDRIVRAKYAVVSLEQFRRGNSRRWFHSYLWARFAQPVGLLWARDENVVEQVVESLSEAVVTFVGRSLPQAGPEFDAGQLWRVGLGLTYRAELRSERPDRAASLVDAAPGYYEAVTAAALARTPFPVRTVERDGRVVFQARIPAAVRLGNRIGWSVRAVQGKVLSVLRLLKAVFTFQGGVDYILWKIERHSGVRVEVPERLRNSPLRAALVLSWRLYRKGAFR